MTSLRLFGKTPRCWWCGKKINNQPRQVQVEMFGKHYETIVCSGKHEHAVADAYAYVKKVFILFPIGLLLGGLLFLANALFHWGNGPGLLLIGITLIVCPFATPQTVQMIGLNKSFWLGRIMGLGVSIWALVLLFRGIAG